MTDLNWNPVSPLQETIAGHLTSSDAHAIHLQEMRDFAVMQIMARRGRWAETAKAAKAAFGVAPSSESKLVSGKACILVWSGPDQFLAISSKRDRKATKDLISHFHGLASLSEQSDGRVLVSVSGARVRDMLAKICSLDLHPDVFPVGTAAVTAIDHLSTNIWRDEDNADGQAVFKLLLLSTFAVSLWGLLVDASAEYNVKVDTQEF